MSTIFILLMPGMMTGQPVNGQNILLSVNGEPVTEAEFIFHMKQQRALIYSHFFINYGAEPDAAFWTSTFAGNTPLEAIKDSTIQRLTDIKIHLLLARDLGIIEDISYDAFQNSLQAENKKRSDAIREGRTIYGPQEYSEEAYFVYWYSNLLIRTRKAWDLRKQDAHASDEKETGDNRSFEKTEKTGRNSNTANYFKDYTDSLRKGGKVHIVSSNLDDILLTYLK